MKVSPKVISLQRMTDICETFANNNGLIFNEKKSAVITRFVSESDPKLVLQGQLLSWESRLTYMGVKLSGDSAAVESKGRKYFGAVNFVVSRLWGKVISDEAWMRIVDFHLLPILLYGCHLWDMKSTTTVRSVNAAFRKGVKRGLGP